MLFLSHFLALLYAMHEGLVVLAEGLDDRGEADIGLLNGGEL